MNENSLSGAPPEVLAAANTLFQSGAFLPQKVINYDPYMKPGVIGNTAADVGLPREPGGVEGDGVRLPSGQGRLSLIPRRSPRA